jgi:Meiotically up-regulated gene 113
VLEYCYVVHSERLAAFKIGCTINLRTRLMALQSQLNVTPVLALGIYNTSERRGIVCGWMERGLHQMFDEKRMRSYISGSKTEWFHLDNADLEKIRLVKVPHLQRSGWWRGEYVPPFAIAEGESHPILRVKFKPVH